MSLRLRPEDVEPGSGDTYKRTSGSRFSVYPQAPFFTKILERAYNAPPFDAQTSVSETTESPKLLG